MIYPKIPISHLLSFVEEDAPFGDITSDLVINPCVCTAVITTRASLVLAGLEETIALAKHYDLRIIEASRDGTEHGEGEPVLTMEGEAHSILLLERTILNILGRMSGIATLTHMLQNQVSRVNPDVRICATRKTAPGLRLLDKKAAMIGGADPHRFSLSDAVLIKDNHRQLVPVEDAVRRAREACAYHRIEAEADTVEEAVSIARAGADIVLLDNMPPDTVREAISRLKNEGLRDSVRIEVSGNVTAETIESYASLDIDRISLGILTHSVRNADLSLDIQR